jgi:hypothetical protein
MDPTRAAATRARFLERIDREDRLVLPAHFPSAAGHLVPEDGAWGWRAHEPDEASVA